MPQPAWQCIANLGDADPFAYGGLFVHIDTTGVYPPECERIKPPGDDRVFDSPKARWEHHRWILEPCTYIDGVLSDNPYHPTFEAWFADSIPTLAESCDMDTDEFAAKFTSDDPLERASAWRDVGEHHGFINLDQYPDPLTRDEAEQRCDAMRCDALLAEIAAYESRKAEPKTM